VYCYIVQLQGGDSSSTEDNSAVPTGGKVDICRWINNTSDAAWRQSKSSPLNNYHRWTVNTWSRNCRRSSPIQLCLLAMLLLLLLLWSSLLSSTRRCYKMWLILVPLKGQNKYITVASPQIFTDHFSKNAYTRFGKKSYVYCIGLTISILSPLNCTCRPRKFCHAYDGL